MGLPKPAYVNRGNGHLATGQLIERHHLGGVPAHRNDNDAAHAIGRELELDRSAQLIGDEIAYDGGAVARLRAES